MSKEQNKSDLFKKFTKFFIAYNTTHRQEIFQITGESIPKLNNNSKAIFAFVLGCELNEPDKMPVLNPSLIQKGINCTMSRRTIYNHIKMLVDAKILIKSQHANKDFFYLTTSEDLRKVQYFESTREEKKADYTNLLTHYRSDLSRTQVRNIFPTSNISERYLNLTSGVEKVKQVIVQEKDNLSGLTVSTTKEKSFKDTEKNSRFEPEKNGFENSLTPRYTEGAGDFSFIMLFLSTLQKLLYPQLQAYQRALVIKNILIFTTPKQQDNALDTIIKVHNYLKKHPDYKLHKPEFFFDQNAKQGFFKALNWKNFDRENKKYNETFVHIRAEVKACKSLYYKDQMNIEAMIKRSKMLMEKYNNDPRKQKYIQKSMLSFIESKNNLFTQKK